MYGPYGPYGMTGYNNYNKITHSSLWSADWPAGPIAIIIM